VEVSALARWQALDRAALGQPGRTMNAPKPPPRSRSGRVPIKSLPGATYVGPHFLSDDHGCYHAEPNSHGANKSMSISPATKI
jgi:hypothetical protein